MVYMRCSISAQSQDSVPPAPALISSKQLKASSSLSSVDLNSRFSMASVAMLNLVSSSSSELSPSLKNSRITSVSSILSDTVRYCSIHFLLSLISLSMDSALDGSFQKSGSPANCSFSFILTCRLSTSKILV